MTRGQGRRAAPRPQGGPPARDLPRAFAALVLAVATVAALFAAGATDRATGPRPVAGSRLDLGARTFTCTGGLPGTTAVAGAVGTDGVSVEGRQRSGRAFGVQQPLRVVADRDAARRAFAVQASHGPRWLATAPCPEPRPDWWFVGAGAGDRHASVLTVANPRPGTAIFDVDVIGPDGPVSVPGLHGLTLAPGRSRAIDLAKMTPAGGDVAVRVRASQGLVAAAMAERWAPSLIGKQTRAWVAAQPAPARELDLIGLPRAAGATLVVANPASREAVVRLRVVSRSGTFEPTGHATVTVPAGAVRDVDVSHLLDGRSAALRLTATLPVAATVRSFRGVAESYATAAQHLAGTSVVGVHGAPSNQLVLASVGRGGGSAQRTRVAVEVTAGNGRTLASRTVVVAPGGSSSLDLPARAEAVSLRAAGGEVVGAVVSRSAAGIATVPVAPAVTLQRRPGVLPAW